MSSDKPTTPMSSQGSPGSSSQSFKIYSPAVDFIENRTSQYHEAFDTDGLCYNPSQNQFVALVPTPIVPTPSGLAMPEHTTLPQPRLIPGSINNMKSWAEALSRGNETAEQGASATGRISNPMGNSTSINVARCSNKTTVPLQQVMESVPDVDIAMPVIGVVKMLLDAYCQAAEVRETVNSGFDDLPDCFVKIDFNFSSYPKDQNIIDASIDLVFVTFKAIEEAVRFYTSSQVKRASTAVLTGSQYKQNLRQSLVDIKTHADALESQAWMSFNHRMLSDGDQNRRSHAVIMQDNWATHQILGTVLQVEQHGQVWVRAIFNLMLSLLREQERNWLPQSPIPFVSIAPGLGSWLQCTPQDLRLRLYIPDIDIIDLQHVLNRAADIYFEDRHRAEQVVGTRVFGEWIINPGSAKLLIHGDFGPTHKISPLSVMCATITQAFRMSPRIISLVFFCGCHLIWDEYRGTVTMIRSLVAQLLRQFPFFNIELDPQISIQAIENGSIEHLCNLFVHLVRLLPPGGTVFCVIDGINEYEHDEYLYSMGDVVLALVDLVDKHSQAMGAKFKLLLTSPRPTREVRKVFDNKPGTLLHMKTLPSTQGRGGFARLRQQLGAGI
ncbi:hypothetical protein F4810DRAFT_723127 [Camillea tinctor]|nr:hypothetical protein F4810DRAFT_723127 [Camillea tinctor]